MGRAHGLKLLGQPGQAAHTAPLPGPACAAACYDSLTQCLVTLDSGRGRLSSRCPSTGATIASSCLSTGSACAALDNDSGIDSPSGDAAADISTAPDSLHGDGRGYVVTGQADGSVKVGRSWLPAGVMVLAAAGGTVAWATTIVAWWPCFVMQGHVLPLPLVRDCASTGLAQLTAAIAFLALQVWQLPCCTLVAQQQACHPSAVAAVHMDGGVVGSACGRELRAWSWRSGQLLATWDNNQLHGGGRAAGCYLMCCCQACSCTCGSIASGCTCTLPTQTAPSVPPRTTAQAGTAAHLWPRLMATLLRHLLIFHSPRQPATPAPCPQSTWACQAAARWQ